MPTDLPPDYKPAPMPGPEASNPDAPSPGAVPATPGSDLPRPPGETPLTGPDVAAPGTAGAPAGLPSF